MRETLEDYRAEEQRLNIAFRRKQYQLSQRTKEFDGNPAARDELLELQTEVWLLEAQHTWAFTVLEVAEESDV